MADSLQGMESEHLCRIFRSDGRPSKRPSGSGIHIHSHPDPGSFVNANGEHLHPVLRQKVYIIALFAFNPVDGCDLHTSETLCGILLQQAP